MNNKMRKALIDHATFFEFQIWIEKEHVRIFINKEESGQWTVDRNDKEMWSKKRGWIPSRFPSKRSIPYIHETEMTLEEAYGVIVTLAI